MRIPAHLRVKLLKQAIANGLKLLTFDIETSHMLVRTFYIGQKVSIQHGAIVRPSQVISIQYMFDTDKRAKYLQWDTVGKNQFDDTSMINEFFTGILPKADIILGQNSDRFDLITLNERAKAQKLSLLQEKPSIDILKLSRQSFRAASHKLDYRSSQQGLGGKIKMVDQDWVDIEERGVPVSKKMAKYGCKDVEDTRKLFWEELPYYKKLPVAIEKLILSFISENDKPLAPSTYRKKMRCPQCIKAKAKSGLSNGRTFDVTANSVSGIAQCNVCKFKWRF